MRAERERRGGFAQIDRRLLGSVLRWRGQPSWAVDVPTTPACNALALVFRHFRIPVDPLVEVAEIAELGEAARRLGNRHLVSGREVSLGADWWRMGGEVLAIEHRRLGPCALIPGSGRWKALQPVEGSFVEHRVDAAFASECENRAVEFLRVPPPGKNGIGSLLQAGMFGLYGELGRRLMAAGAGACLAVVPPIMAALLIDSVIPDGEVAGLLGVALALLVTTLANSFLLAISGLAALRLDNALAYRIESIVLTRELEGRFGRESLPPGEILQRMSAVNWAMGFVTKTTQTVFVQSLQGLANLGLIFVYSPVFGAVALVVSLVYLLLIGGQSVLQYRLNASAESALGRAQERSVQFLRGASFARNRGMTDRLFSRWLRDRTDYAALEYRSASAQNLGAGVGFAIVSVGVCIFYLVVASSAPGAITTGQVVAAYGAYVVLATALKTLATVLNTITSVIPIFARLEPLIGQEEAFSGQDRLPVLEAGFRAIDVEVDSHSGRRAVRTSFDVQPGLLTVVAAEDPAIGPHLLRVLVGLEETRGSVEVDGLRLDSLDVSLFRRSGLVMIQEPQLLPATVRENLDFEGDQDDGALHDALRSVGADARVAEFADGLETTLTGRNEPRDFSSQLAAARTHLRREAFSVLTDRTEFRTTNWGRDFLESVLARGGTTRLMASAAPEILARADRVLVFDARRGLVADGTPEELRASPESLPESMREAFS